MLVSISILVEQSIDQKRQKGEGYKMQLVHIKNTDSSHVAHNDESM